MSNNVYDKFGPDTSKKWKQFKKMNFEGNRLTTLTTGLLGDGTPTAFCYCVELCFAKFDVDTSKGMETT